MAADELKALTVVNLPFIEERYLPGKMIPRDRFEAYVEAAKAAQTSDQGHVPEADEVISDMIQWGSLSEDPEAELHPDHLPVDPNKMTLARLRQHAVEMVALLEEAGEDVPAKLREFAVISDNQVSSIDQGIGLSEATAGEA